MLRNGGGHVIYTDEPETENVKEHDSQGWYEKHVPPLLIGRILKLMLAFPRSRNFSRCFATRDPGFNDTAPSPRADCLSQPHV
jgi:hypothetical protein